MPIVIHGKAYKPDVTYCIGSYSTLVGFYVKEMGHDVHYLDPLADDATDVIDHLADPCVLLLAHNRLITYGYTGEASGDHFYAKIPTRSIIVDPWRRLKPSDEYTVIYYGQTRQ